MLFLVTYDVVDDRRRTHLAKALKDFGDRVQYSVFECKLKSAHLVQMIARIERIINIDEDSVRIYHLCGACEEKLEIIGTGFRTEDPDVYIL